MKILKNIGKALMLLIVSCTICLAQESESAVLRNLENLESQAILKGDTTMLLKLLSPHVVVQNPENAIVGLRQIVSRIKTGKIKYASFERKIENIAFVQNIAIVMGEEILRPEGISIHGGKTVIRRFTNIWLKERGSWKLTARQATIVSVK